MAKQLFGITDRDGKWMFYQDGKLMAFDDVRLAFANLSRIARELPGAPFLVREIGDMGEPVDLTAEPIQKAKK